MAAAPGRDATLFVDGALFAAAPFAAPLFAAPPFTTAALFADAFFAALAAGALLPAPFSAGARFTADPSEAS